MSESNEQENFFQRAFDRGFDFGQSDELADFICKPDRTDGEERNVSMAEMADALLLSGAIAGLAIRFADMMGEDNAKFALNEAARAVAVHCEHKRAAKNAN